MAQIKLSIVCDYLEEKWYSMDLCAEMLIENLHKADDKEVALERICPKFKPRLQNIPLLGKKNSFYNADRLLNRFWDYPNYLKDNLRIDNFNFYHVVDHSYAQLVHVLPKQRVGVYCHDIDAFRSILKPAQEIRPAWYRAISGRILSGLQKSAIVFYSTEAVASEIKQHQLIDPACLIQAPLGISPEFNLLNYLDPGAEKIFRQIVNTPYILHIGSCIPRKRIDVLLEVFSRLRKIYPELLLVKIGGQWTQEQFQQIEQNNLQQAIIHLHNLNRTTIAQLYRRSVAVLLTSEAEGFGLPVIEALACGTVVVASDIPVLKEVGGNAILYCPLEQVETWTDLVSQLLVNPELAPSLALRLAQADKYSWSRHAAIIQQSYLNLAGKAQ